jgi:hypothetical protein
LKKLSNVLPPFYPNASEFDLDDGPSSLVLVLMQSTTQAPKSPLQAALLALIHPTTGVEIPSFFKDLEALYELNGRFGSPLMVESS